MKQLLLYVLTIIIISTSPLAGACQNSSNPLLTKKVKEEVVDQIAKLLNQHYVFADTAKRMGAYLKQQLRAGAYDKITEPIAFSDKLLADVYSVYPDRHLLILYFPSSATQQPQATMPTDSEANYGFQRVEVLNGNIGYINLSGFRALGPEGISTIKAALHLLIHTNAIIFDVRNNRGGAQEAASNIAGFFFKEPTLIERFYNRYENATTEYRTRLDADIDLSHVPLYVLTSTKSFSCAEMFAYDLQVLKRATIVGEVTGGGAHGQFRTDASHGFVIHIPYWRSINPITGTNWEHVGVKPDVQVPAGDALKTAELMILQSLLSKARTRADSFRLNWELDLFRAQHYPVVLDTNTLAEYSGVFEDRVFTIENGKLYYQRTGRPKFELEAINPTLLKAKDNDYFKIRFVRNSAGVVDKVIAYYQDDRVEESVRTR